MKSQSTFGGIDFLRFAAALLVVVHHFGFWAWAYPNGMAGMAATVDPQPQIPSTFASGWVGVQLFFVISGFVIAFSAAQSTAGRFVESRLRRLLPAVLVCAPLSAAVVWAFDVLSPSATFFAFIRSVVFFPWGPWVDSVYWTLGIEVSFYFFIYLLLLFRNFHRIEWLAYAFAASSTFFWILFLIFAWDTYGEKRIFSLLLIHHGCFFSTGLCLWLVKFRGITVSRIFLLFFSSVGACIQIIETSRSIGAKTDSVLSALPAISIYFLGLILLVLSLNTRWNARWLRQIGLMTYPLYLLHNVVGSALLGRLVDVGLGYAEAMLSSIAFCLVISWFIALKLEPLVRYFICRYIPPKQVKVTR